MHRIEVDPFGPRGARLQAVDVLTYLERMVNFDRLYLERSGRYPPQAIHEEMLKRIAFQVEYLVGQKTPAQIAVDRPDLAGVWESIRGSAPTTHNGRPFAWHWQAAATDFLEAWLNLRVPVLVVYGEYDQFETRHGHRLIADAANRRSPGSGTFIEIRAADHDLEFYATPEDAYAYRNPSVRREALLEPLLRWMRQAVGRPAGARP